MCTRVADDEAVPLHVSCPEGDSPAAIMLVEDEAEGLPDVLCGTNSTFGFRVVARGRGGGRNFGKLSRWRLALTKRG